MSKFVSNVLLALDATREYKRDEGGQFSHENVSSVAEIHQDGTQQWGVRHKATRKYLGTVHRDAPSNSYSTLFGKKGESSGHPSVNHAAAHIVNNSKLPKY